MKILASLLLASALAAADSFLDAAKTEYGDYRWASERLVSADLNRDGKSDKAALGLKNDKVALVVRIAGSKEPLLAEIPVDSSRQLGICPGAEPKITVQPQSEAPANALGETPAGYEICPKCFEIRISGGECDPLHFYWDIKDNRLAWWRA